jgi:alpha-D-ribose 1-methylphosphonate 5-triphosphate synthase subunit PhnI
MYVAIKGGEQAIREAHRLLARQRRGNPQVPELTVEQIGEQLRLAVDRVMTEGSLYDRELAALAIKQAQGDLIEAIFLLRAYRTTLPRLVVTCPIDTATMHVRRRLSATFKDIPGGQLLGATFDYTHRLLDFSLLDALSPQDDDSVMGATDRVPVDAARINGALPRVVDLLRREGLVEPVPPDDAAPVGDITRQPLAFPAPRDLRLQNLARGDEGFLLALGYATQRGYGHNHPFAGEIRIGEVTLVIEPPELDFSIAIGQITITECDMINQFQGSPTVPPQFTRGYGLAFGQSERKAMAMALVDRALRAQELGEIPNAPAQDQEFVLSHSDNVEASGFVQHLKLPHHVDFQAELHLVRQLRAQYTHNTTPPTAATASEEDTCPGQQ